MEPQHQRADYHQRQLYADEHAEFRIAPVYFQATPAYQREMQATNWRSAGKIAMRWYYQWTTGGQPTAFGVMR